MVDIWRHIDDSFIKYKAQRLCEAENEEVDDSECEVRDTEEDCNEHPQTDVIISLESLGDTVMTTNSEEDSDISEIGPSDSSIAELATPDYVTQSVQESLSTPSVPGPSTSLEPECNGASTSKPDESNNVSNGLKRLMPPTFESTPKQKTRKTPRHVTEDEAVLSRYLATHNIKMLIQARDKLKQRPSNVSLKSSYLNQKKLVLPVLLKTKKLLAERVKSLEMAHVKRVGFLPSSEFGNNSKMIESAEAAKLQKDLNVINRFIHF